MIRMGLSAPKQKFVFFILSCLLAIFCCTTAALSAPIKIGVYENKPLVYSDADGEYQGLTIDILRYIAKQEGWTLQFIPGTWTECLERLQAGETDLQVAIAISDQRKKLYDFPKETLITNWGRLYRYPGAKVDSLLDLDNKKIALLKRDIHAKVFFNLMDQFGKQVTPIYEDNYDDVLKRVERGEASAGVINRMYAMQNAQRFNVETTGMIFNPIEVRYAAPKGKNSELLQAIDLHLKELRNDKNSIYYQSLEKWFGHGQGISVPAWIKTGFLLISSLLLLILLHSRILKKQVKQKTAELKNTNQQLTEQVAQLEKAKNSLYESEKSYRTLLKSTAEGFWMIDPELKTTQVNESLCQMLGYSEEEMLGKTPFDFVDQANLKKFQQETDQIGQSDHRHYEIDLRRKDGSTLPAFFNATTLRDDSGKRIGSFAFINDLTERKQVEIKLRESEEKFRTMLNQQNEAVFLHRQAEGRYMPFSMVNDVAIKRYGYSEEELLQLSAADITPSEEVAKIIAAGIPQKIASKDGAIFETLHRKKSGELIPVEANAKVIELSGVKYILSTVRDITERKAAEQKIIESEKKYRSLLNNQNDAVFLHQLKMDGFSNFVEVNDIAVQRYGYSREELLQLTPADIDVPEVSTKERFLKIRAELQAQGHTVFESLQRKKSGERFPVEINSSLVEFNGAQFILASVRDITERKIAEREKQLSNERFTTVLNSVDAGIFVADMKNHEILFMNQHLIEKFGQDFTGQTCWQAFHNEPNPCQHCSNEKLVDEHGEPTGMLIWQEENPETGKHYMNYDRAIHWVDGRLVKLQISTDITEVKNLETQLRQKYKMEAVGLMAGGIAHDFNNVLAIIITNLELMLRKVDAENPLRPRLEQAKSASQRAGELVKQILAYSRQGEQRLQPVQLAFIVEEALKLMRSTTPASIEVETQIAPDAQNEMIQADSTQIEEVLINLCTNAVHAMDEKGLLSVSLQKSRLTADSLPQINNLKSGEYMELTVSDTGSGMPPEVIEKIFDPFYTTKPAGQGTGMGLSISYGIIKKHSGYMVVESNVGKGSRFSIFLPISNAKQLPQLHTNQRKLPTGNEKILLVDDEKALAESLADFLREHGYQTSIETDSREALQRLISSKEDFDLLISDQTMPELSGLELAAETLQHKPEQKIILCTGYSATMNEQDALQRGIKAVFMKPVDLPSLTRKIRNLLDEN